MGELEFKSMFLSIEPMLLMGLLKIIKINFLREMLAFNATGNNCQLFI